MMIVQCGAAYPDTVHHTGECTFHSMCTVGNVHTMALCLLTSADTLILQANDKDESASTGNQTRCW